MLRHPLALLLLAILPLTLGGCLFDKPLTSPSELTSPNLDSRLFGVFEFRTKSDKPKRNSDRKPDDAATEDEDDIQRIAIMPDGPPLLSGRTGHYIIYYRDFSKKPARTYKFLGWLSRVDSVPYLSFRDDTEGSETFGKYGFFRFEWEFPGNIVLYTPDMKDVEHATSSYAMRRALREKLKAGTAFPYTPTYWRKIARVWWDPTGAADGTSIPPEFEKGTTVENPGF